MITGEFRNAKYAQIAPLLRSASQHPKVGIARRWRNLSHLGAQPKVLSEPRRV
ncbi:hypothetical protein [Pikeienuella sp. HZG-20]|uniref:hypothetical protein n=1 Tax=Paludibacillus litoralis TaxID=3133267 RepID=UPI0030EF5DAC